MRVELEGSLKQAISKRCVWMGEGIESSEGAQDEASQHYAQQTPLFNRVAQDREPSKCCRI